jgi:hypothetical protein
MVPNLVSSLRVLGMRALVLKIQTLLFLVKLPSCHALDPKEANQSSHTCAQDVEITHAANNKVNSSQHHNYIITRVLLQNDHWSEIDYRASSTTTIILSAA